MTLVPSPCEIVFGIQEPRPIAGIPADAIGVRIRQRNDDLVKVYVRTHRGCSIHDVEAHGRVWKLGPALGQNLRTHTRSNVNA